jgi:hypothetical protein
VDKAKTILKTAARHALVGVADLLILIARGSTWLADRARRVARWMENA